MGGGGTVQLRTKVYGNSSLMDAGEFVSKLPEKCLESVLHKYNAYRNIILNLFRCNYCNDVRLEHYTSQCF